MNQPENNNDQIPEWCFPSLARAAGIIILIFGILDYLVVQPQIFMPLSFLLMLAGMRVCSKNFETAQKAGIAWLPMSFQLWGWLNIFTVIIYRFLPGMLRHNVINYAMRAPLWLVFGIWLTWHAHQIVQARKSCADHRSLCIGTARALFRFSLLLMLFYLVLTDLPMFFMQPADGQTATFWPLHCEYMTKISNDTASGVLGLPAVQKKLNAILNPAFDLPLNLFLWFLLQFLLVPLFWFLSGKSLPWLLCLLPVANSLVLVGLPLQISRQYGLVAFGTTGFIQTGYWLLWLPVFLQFVSVPFFFSADKKSKQAATREANPLKPLAIAHPRRSVFAGIAVVIILSFLMPYVKRSAIENLLLASKAGRSDQFSYYLDQAKRQNPENPLGKALCQAIDQKQTGLVKWLLNQKPDLNQNDSKQGYPPLWWALRRSGDFAVTEMLLQAGANPNLSLGGYDKLTATGFVISGNFAQDETIKYLHLLASYGADLKLPVNADGNYPVEYALRKNYHNPLVVLELIKLGAEPLKTSRDNIFYRVMLTRKPELMQAFFNSGMTAQTRDADGNTFLHQLAKESDFEREQLRDYKVDSYLPEVVNAKNAAGKTPLHLAVEMKKRRSVEALLSLGADQNLTDATGVSPRSFAEKQPIIPLLKLMDKFSSVRQPSAQPSAPDPNQ